MKTRFCPSPTGLMHIGNARTALFNALFAQHEQGDFLLRIEDTDIERSKPEFVDALKEDLTWLHCNWCDGVEVQSQRMDIYNKYYDVLLEKNLAYPCFATEEELKLMRKLQRAAGKPPRYDGRYAKLSKEEAQAKIDAGEPYTLRLRIPEDAVIEFTDLIKGSQKFLGKDIGDFIIRRQNGMPTFMFCNAIDDSLCGVTHALRGEDHLTNTPRQLLILQALELRAPEYGHFSLITKKAGDKLSKREGDQSIRGFRERGYLSTAIINYMSRLSHSYESNELMSFDQLSQNFSMQKFSKAPAKFDEDQLKHWQKLAVLALTQEELFAWLQVFQAQVPEQHWQGFCDLMQQNVVLFDEVRQWLQILFTDQLQYSAEQQALLQQAGKEYFAAVLKSIDTHGLDVKQMIAVLKELGLKGKALFQPLRVVLTGQLHGPELGAIVALMDVEIVRQRVSVLVR